MNDAQRIARAQGALINALATEAHWLATSRQLAALIGGTETQAYVRKMLRGLEERGAVAHIGSGEASRWTLAANKQRAIALHLGPPKPLALLAARREGCSIADAMQVFELSEAVARRKMWHFVERGTLFQRTYPNRMIRFFATAEAAAAYELPILSRTTWERRRKAGAFTVVTAQDKQAPRRGTFAPDAQAIMTASTRRTVAPAPAPRWDVSQAVPVISAAQCRPWAAAAFGSAHV